MPTKIVFVGSPDPDALSVDVAPDPDELAKLLQSSRGEAVAVETPEGGQVYVRQDAIAYWRPVPAPARPA